MNFGILAWFCLVAMSSWNGILCQTYCSLKVPVPNIGVCDANGLLAEQISASVYETKGSMMGMSDYQRDTLNIFNQQFDSILEHTKSTDGQIRGIEEEINDLRTLLQGIQVIQAHDEGVAANADVQSRHRRAASSIPSQTQQLIDSAKLAVQQMMFDIGQKLQNLTKELQDDDKQHKALHARLQTELANNQQLMASTKQELATVDAAIQKAIKARTKGNTGGTTSLANLTSEVTQLVIDGATMDKVAQRQTDNIEKQLQQVGISVPKISASLQSVTSTVSTLEKAVTNNTRAVSILKGAEKQYETQIGKSLSDIGTSITILQQRAGTLESKATQLGSDVLNAVVNTSKVTADVTALRKEVDSVQTLVTLSKKAELAQLTDIVSLRRDVTDNINVMKYVFGQLATLP